MPLSQFLVPQLYRKAQEIEAQIGPPAGAGYLNVGYEKTPSDPNGSYDKPKERSYDPDSQLGRVLAPMGRMQRSGDPLQEAFARGENEGIAGNPTVTGAKELAPAPAAPTRFLRAQAQNPRVIPAQTGAVGVNERGESVDAAGKSLGYLNAPAIVTPSGEVPARTGERRQNDVGLGAGSTDKYGRDALIQRYGDHLKVYQENRGAFPKGYFKGMSARQRDDIMKAVDDLTRRERSDSEGISA